MEGKEKIELQENSIPIWIKLLWGIFIIWALIYLSSYWIPDLAHWMKTTDPDATQWQRYIK